MMIGGWLALPSPPWISPHMKPLHDILFPLTMLLATLCWQCIEYKKSVIYVCSYLIKYFPAAYMIT